MHLGGNMHRGLVFLASKIHNFWSSNSNIEYEGKGYRNKTLSVEKYLNKIKLDHTLKIS